MPLIHAPVTCPGQMSLSHALVTYVCVLSCQRLQIDVNITNSLAARYGLKGGERVWWRLRFGKAGGTGIADILNSTGAASLSSDAQQKQDGKHSTVSNHTHECMKKSYLSEP